MLNGIFVVMANKKKPSLFKHCKEARLELTVQIYKDFFIRAIFFVENAVFSHGSFIFRFGSSLCFRGLDAMGRMRETSLQVVADTKNGFPYLAVAWGNP